MRLLFYLFKFSTRCAIINIADWLLIRWQFSCLSNLPREWQTRRHRRLRKAADQGELPGDVHLRKQKMNSSLTRFSPQIWLTRTTVSLLFFFHALKYLYIIFCIIHFYLILKNLESVTFPQVCHCNWGFFFSLQLPAISPGAVSSLVAPVLLKYRVCRPRLLLAGSRAEIDPAADVALLHGEVLLIEDAARQYNPIGGNFFIIFFFSSYRSQSQWTVISLTELI